jgi:hypothetical protein
VGPQAGVGLQRLCNVHSPLPLLVEAWNLEWRGPQFEIETQPRANSDLDSRALLQLQQRGNQWCIESTGVQFFFSFGVLERD